MVKSKKNLPACGKWYQKPNKEKCSCGEPHISDRIVHRYNGKPCYVRDSKEKLEEEFEKHYKRALQSGKFLALPPDERPKSITGLEITAHKLFKSFIRQLLAEAWQEGADMEYSVKDGLSKRFKSEHRDCVPREKVEEVIEKIRIKKSEEKLNHPRANEAYNQALSDLREQLLDKKEI